MNTPFFCGSIIRTVMSLKAQNTNVLQFAKEANFTWSQLKRNIELIQSYKLITVTKHRGTISFDLTDDGKDVRDYLWRINTILRRNTK